MRKPTVKWTAERIEQFFAELGKHGVVTRAAHAVGVSPKSVYDRKLRDTEFARRMDEVTR